MSPSYTIALAGNPNAGKSTIFNALTGSRQHVGNWPGKTVEKKEGRLQVNGHELVLVDLPGTYSLTAFSVEEIIARDFIVEEAPDAVVAVVDSSNLERNLYLVVQLVEMGVPVILALNMSDVAERRQIKIDREKLALRLGHIPVIAMVGSREIGMDSLRFAIFEVAQCHARNVPRQRVTFAPLVAEEIDHLQLLIEADEQLGNKYPPRWLAIKLLEGDEAIHAKAAHNPALLAAVAAAEERIMDRTAEDAETLIVDSRYAFINDLISDAITYPEIDTVTLSDKIDRLLTHRIWGLPMFLLMMWLVFQITANASAPFVDWIDNAISGPITRWAISIMGVLGLGGSWLESLLVDGVIAGVGGVLVFIPVLATLYLVIAVLEDSGYMARAAFVMDRLMQALGLHGKSFLPMLVGFGCTVPAIYATRTLENSHDRRITAFLTTFMSCGGRLPIYVVFGVAFFGAGAGNLVFAMYLTGIGVAILTSLLLTKLVFRNKPTPPFVMELPPYRMPSARNAFKNMWQRSAAFIRKAGTLILAASIVIWFLLAIPAPGKASSEAHFNDVRTEESMLGVTSSAVAPVFKPAGFDDWEAGAALATGVLAKETVISTMSQTYIGAEDEDAAEMDTPSLGEDLAEIGRTFGEATLLTGQELLNTLPRTLNLVPGIDVGEFDFFVGAEEGNDTALTNALNNAFSPLAALAFNVFVLLYVPCMSAVATMRQEFGWRWMALQVAYTLLVAWLAAVVVFQVGTLLGF
jgi:ferrous iron transport protein B